MSKKEVKDLNKIFIEKLLIKRLLTQTVELIHSTKVIEAIKKLTGAYEILDLSQEIFKNYNNGSNFCWDKSAVQDLNNIGKELVVFHRFDFNPEHKVFRYNEGISNLILTLEAADRVYNK